MPNNNNGGTFQTTDGLRLSEKLWLPKETKAVVVLIHGYAEHSRRYGHVGEYLAQRGYSLCAFDLRGHGKSEGERAFISSFDEYLQDAEVFLSRARERAKGRPIFILGHSLGGTIATLFVLERRPQIAGLILSGPLLKFSSDISPFHQKLALILGAVFPKFPVAKKLDSRFISRDPEVVRRYEDDPLVYRGWTFAREAAEIVRALKRVSGRMEEITLPLLILQGSNDHLANVEGSAELSRRAGSRDKTLKLYEGLYHEVLNETEKARVLADLAAWLDARVKI